MKDVTIELVVDPDAMPDDNILVNLIEASIRAIAHECGPTDEWPEKYGTDFENETFRMHPYCWCEGDICSYCNNQTNEGRQSPNFLYKPSGLSVWWYKYIGRSMEVEGELNAIEIVKMVHESLLSIETKKV